MIPIKKALTSTVGQKFLMALSGLGLIGFTVIHLLGNLTLYRRSGDYFNLYAHTLDSYGPLLTIAEIGLLVVVMLHVVTAIWIQKINRQARPQGYRVWKSKGVRPNETKVSNISSRYMIFTGVTLFGFLLLHIWQFRFGPGKPEGYTTEAHGIEVRDLHRLVVETFQNPLFVGIYITAMIVLGIHLRHGIWSALQSLGWMNKRSTGPVHLVGSVVATVLAIGFLFIPVWMYFGMAGGAQ
jgi:succinate dehydrogenase / fumarate reductase cytochrome b subunit